MTEALRIALAVVPFALVVACTDAAKAPAEAAMAAAGAAVESLQGEAAKFAPDAVKAVQASYASAKELVAKQDYKGALAAAGDMPAQGEGRPGRRRREEGRARPGLGGPLRRRPRSRSPT